MPDTSTCGRCGRTAPSNTLDLNEAGTWLCRFCSASATVARATEEQQKAAPRPLRGSTAALLIVGGFVVTCLGLLIAALVAFGRGFGRAL